MQNVEAAIYKALSQIDASQAAQRRRVYESAWHAHERALQENTSLSDAELNERREQLTQQILAIEQQYQQAYPETDDAGSQDGKSGFYTEGPEEEVPLEAPSLEAASPVYAHKKGKRSKSRPSMFLSFIILAVVVGGFVLWAFYNSLVGSSRPDQPVANSVPPQQVVQENTAGAQRGHDADTDGFSRIFNPQDVSSVAVRGGATAELHNEGDENYVHIIASQPGDAVVIELGEGVISAIRGKMVTFDVYARSAGEKASSLAISCDFGNGVNCGRHRFEVPVTPEHFPFMVQVSDQATGAGNLQISTDFLGEGNAVDLFDIKMKIANQ